VASNRRICPIIAFEVKLQVKLQDNQESSEGELFVESESGQSEEREMTELLADDKEEVAVL
jgi:hypothetical protein